MFKSVVLALASLFAASQSQHAPIDTINGYRSNDLVPRITCSSGVGRGTVGSGARINSDRVVTAWHVIDEGQCLLDGEPFTVMQKSERLDFALLRTTPRAAWWPVHCLDTKLGGSYDAYGYALGGPVRRSRVFATIRHPTPSHLLPGFGETLMFVGDNFFIFGQSGGPIIDRQTNQLVGIVIGFTRQPPHLSLGRLLTDTSLCQGR